MENILNLLSCDKNVLVIGDLILDNIIECNTNRISSEQPIPVYVQSNSEYRLGGAGNVARNLANYNLNTFLLSIIEPKYKNNINSLLNKYNINNLSLLDTNYKTPIKTRYVSSRSQCFRIDIENHNEFDIQMLCNEFDKIIDNIDMILLSDYGNGILSDSFVKYVINIANKKGIKTLVDPKRGNYDKYYGATLIKPNKEDAEYYCKFKIKNEDDISRAIRCFRNNLSTYHCVLTLSGDGILCSSGVINKHINVENKLEVVDVTGAGDTVISTLCLCLLNKIDIFKSCEIANIFAGDVINRIGCVPVNLLSISQKYNKVITSKNQLIILSQLIKKYNKKVVLTSGCFDLLHEGHIKSLKTSKQFGDLLFVALNSDKSIKLNKGPNRPICNLSSRLAILSSFDFIDFIMVFDEKTPIEIYNVLKPNIIAKGEDYTEEQMKQIIPGDYELKRIKFDTDISSTKIINKIIHNFSNQ